MNFQKISTKLYVISSIKHDNITYWLLSINFAYVIKKSSTYKGTVFFFIVW